MLCFVGKEDMSHSGNMYRLMPNLSCSERQNAKMRILNLSSGLQVVEDLTGIFEHGTCFFIPLLGKKSIISGLELISTSWLKIDLM